MGMARGRLMLRLTPNTSLPPTLDTLDTLAMDSAMVLAMDMETVPMLDLAMEDMAILVLDILEPEVTMARGMLMLRLIPSTWLPHTADTPDTLVMALAILAMAILVFWEPEVTMARGMLMPRLTPSTLLVIPMLGMVLAMLVIPTLVPMDMETLAMLVLAMLVLDSAMDTPTLQLLEPAETILELLSPAKYELYLTFMIPCLLPFVFNKKSITLLK